MDEIRPGVYPANQLYKAIGRASLEKLIREKKAESLRTGWVKVGEPAQDIVNAIRRGGVLSCLSALKRHHVWVPEFHDLHVRGNRWAVANRRGPFCRRFGRPLSEYGAVDDVPTALAHAARCLDDEGLVVVTDSILHLGLMSLDEVEYLFRDAPERIRRLLGKCDHRAESGPESMVRFRLSNETVKVDIQVPIDGVGRVDLLVGRWLIIETDGFEFHGDKPTFSRDRRRMVDAQIRGYTYLPFSYEQIAYQRESSHAQMMTAIRNGAHRRPAQITRVVPEER
ncbi:hypothetical protein [Gordonia sp. MP11Mi]|uniref:DUF559 domain-containing protein n=1 Tax=Gordonia sp. MP11Mi TaxID=3022769 RepID=A0AA97CS66_9ACTN